MLGERPIQVKVSNPVADEKKLFLYSDLQGFVSFLLHLKDQ